MSDYEYVKDHHLELILSIECKSWGWAYCPLEDQRFVDTKLDRPLTIVYTSDRVGEMANDHVAS